MLRWPLLNGQVYFVLIRSELAILPFIKWGENPNLPLNFKRVFRIEIFLKIAKVDKTQNKKKKKNIK